MNSKSKASHDQARDRNLVSSEPYEVRYVVDKLAAEFPRQEKEDLKRIVLEAKQTIQPSEDREKLLNEVRRVLNAE